MSPLADHGLGQRCPRAPRRRLGCCAGDRRRRGRPQRPRTAPAPPAPAASASVERRHRPAGGRSDRQGRRRPSPSSSAPPSGTPSDLRGQKIAASAPATQGPTGRGRARTARARRPRSTALRRAARRAESRSARSGRWRRLAAATAARSSLVDRQLARPRGRTATSTAGQPGGLHLRAAVVGGHGQATAVPQLQRLQRQPHRAAAQVGEGEPRLVEREARAAARRRPAPAAGRRRRASARSSRPRQHPAQQREVLDAQHAAPRPGRRPAPASAPAHELETARRTSPGATRARRPSGARPAMATAATDAGRQHLGALAHRARQLQPPDSPRQQPAQQRPPRPRSPANGPGPARARRCSGTARSRAPP